MLDPIREHGAYIEILMAIRGHLSLTHVATYLGSKPQNVAGWLAAQSVPTLKDFRARLLEMAFYLQHIAQERLSLGGPALQVVAEHPPILPPWGISMPSSAEAVGTPDAASSEEGKPLEKWTQRFVSNVRDLLPPSAVGDPRQPNLSWKKLSQLKQFYDEDRPRGAKPGAKEQALTTVVVWGESCAGKSTLANALLGAELFSATPVPEPAGIKVLRSNDRALVEIAGYDGPAPTPAANVQLLRFLLNSQDCRLFFVMGGTDFPIVNRSALLSQLALLPCKLTLVFSKLDLHQHSEDQDQVVRYLRASYASYRLYATSLLKIDELMLNELRAAAGLVGTARFQMVAAASDGHDPSGEEAMLQTITALVREVCKLGDILLEPGTTFHELRLTEPQIGTVLLAIEKALDMKFPDREADLALRGGETIGWLTNVVLPLCANMPIRRSQ